MKLMECFKRVNKLSSSFEGALEVYDEFDPTSIFPECKVSTKWKRERER